MGMILAPGFLRNSKAGETLANHYYGAKVVHDGNSTAFTLGWDADTFVTVFRIRSLSSGSWYILDGLNGYNKYISTNTYTTYTTDANVISVSGDAVTLGTSLASGSYIVEAFKAGEGTETDNNGSLSATVSAGLIVSVCQFTGNATAGATYGHRGTQEAQTPTYIHTRPHHTGSSHGFYHTALGATKRGTYPNTTGIQTGVFAWNDTEPTGAIVTLGYDGTHNRNSTLNTHYIFYDTVFSTAFSYNGTAGTHTKSFDGDLHSAWVKRGDGSYGRPLLFHKEASTNPIDDLRIDGSEAANTYTNDNMEINGVDLDIKATSDNDTNANGILYIGFAVHEAT